MKNSRNLLNRFAKRKYVIITLLTLSIVWSSILSPQNVTKPIDVLNREVLTKDALTKFEVSTVQSESNRQSNKNAYFRYMNIEYIYKPSKLCSESNESGHPFLLIVVKSSVVNTKHRQDIRETWGSFNNSRLKMVFLLGYKHSMENIIKQEYTRYNDLVQFSFIDHYYNNTLKTNMAFDLVVSQCPGASFVFFVDDDYFVHIPNILDFLYFHTKHKTKQLVAGSKNVHWTPIRNKESKWFIPYEVYPYKEYPPFFSGGSYIMDMSVVKMIRSKIPFVKLFKFDDVFLGMVMESLGITLLQERRFSIGYPPQSKLHLVFSAHNFAPPRNVSSEWIRITCEQYEIFFVLYGEPKCFN